MFITAEPTMFKTIVTPVRGAAFRAEGELADCNALLILDQQIRDAAAAPRCWCNPASR